MTDVYNVGKIVNTHGVKGEVRVVTFSDFKEDRYAPGSRLLLFNAQGEQETFLTVRSYRTHKQFDLLAFEAYETLDDVLPLKGGTLKVPAHEREALEENEYYFDQIIGCEVQTEEGQPLGKIAYILSPGANDVWVMTTYEDGQEVLIPYIEDVVKDVNIKQGIITIQLIEGLME